MSSLIYLIPISLVLGALGLVTFLWTLKNGQYEDMEGAAARILTDDDKPLPLMTATTSAVDDSCDGAGKAQTNS